MLPQIFQTITAQDPSWNMDTEASFHLADNTCILTSFSNSSIYSSVFVGNGNFIPVTHTGHNFLHTSSKPLQPNHILVTPHIIKNLIYVRKFTRDNDVSIKFDSYGFSVRDYQTRRILLRCDSTGDLYQVTQQPLSQTPVVLLSFSSTTWHRRLGHPEDDVLRRLESRNLISCRKSKLSALYHACQLGKHAKLPFYNSESSVDYVYPLHKKSDLFDNFVAFRAYVNKQFNVDIKALQCDHGGEYDNTLALRNRMANPSGIDYDETFSPVVKPATIHIVLSLAVSRDWPIHQLDVKNAFLHGHLFETVYMHQPPGFVDPNEPDYHSKTDSYLFVFHRGSDIAYLLLHVDDIILTASLLPSTVKEILERAHMQNCNPCQTPVDTESKFGSDGDPVSDPTLYRSLAGALQYLTFTRPDLSYAVQQVCLYMHDPRDPHFTTLKRIPRYVRGTLDYGLQLHVSSTTQLSAYTDADWAGCPVTLSRSSAEAEYRGVANVVVETAWIHNLLCELHTPLFTATVFYCDNVSAVYMSANLVQRQRTKHIKIDIHFVRNFVASGQVRVLHVPSRF
ncbi:ribonuclease H-like domain-containing protein [Tanacetum coccineum]|uniref:Ribonuclease H-like domain-containing protein n=1 Tax=Tanacetum coccineum TaxID=301880 RepID=A0ABQ5F1S5_9ASTR